MGSRIEMPIFQGFDGNGDPLSGGKLYSYVAGTSTAKALYYDKSLATEASNPVLLNSYGYSQNASLETTGIYGAGTYKLVLKNSAGVTQWTLDNVSGIGGGEGGLYVSDYGCDLAAAVADITTTETTLTIDCDVAVSADTVCPPTLNLRFIRGAVITVATTRTLTIGNMTDPGPFQIFDWAGTGAIVFSSGATDYARPEWFGAVVDDQTVCSATASNKARSALATSGGEIRFNPGTYYALSTFFEISSKIALQGMGVGATILKMADSVNLAAVIQSSNWATMAAGYYWLVSAGVQYGFSIRDMLIHGNYDNNTDGYGIRIYGKQFIVENIIATNCYAGGIKSQCGSATGQTEANYGDLPEAKFKNVSVRYNKGKGFTFFGPHDAVLENFVGAYSEQENLYTDTESGQYSAAGLVIRGVFHTYGGYGRNAADSDYMAYPGVKCLETIHADVMICEDGLHLSGSDTNQSSIDYLKINFGNNRTHTALQVTGNECHFGHARILMPANPYAASTETAIQVTGQRNQFGSLSFYGGSGYAGIYVDLDDNANHFGSIVITEGTATYDSTGIDIASGVDRTKIDWYYATDVKYFVNKGGAGLDNEIRGMFVKDDASQVAWNGTDPDDSELIEIMQLDGTTRTYVWPNYQKNLINNTTTRTLEPYESGAWCRNSTAVGTVTWNLPPAVGGMEFWFFRNEDVDVVINPDDADTINGKVAGKYMLLQVHWDNVLLKCHITGKWIICGGVGTYSYE